MNPLSPLGDGPLPPLAPAATVRARGDQRRRRSRAALAGAGVLAVALSFVGGAALVGGDGRDVIRTPLASAAPTPEYDENGCLIRIPDEPDGVVPTVCTPSPASTATPSRPPTPSATPRPGSDPEQALLTLEDADAAEPGAWERFGDGAAGPLLDPCGGTAYPTDAQVDARASVDLRALREAGGTSFTQQVARYPDPAVAQEAWAGYRRAVVGCPSRVEQGATVTHQVLSETTSGQVRTLLVRRGCGDDCVLGNFVYYAVQQLEDLVAVSAVSQGEDGDPRVTALEPFANAVAERLTAATGG